MSDTPPVKIPRVARPRTRARMAPLALGLGCIGTAVFASLASNRAAQEEQASALPPLRVAASAAPAPPPSEAATPVAAPLALPFTSAPPPPSFAVTPGPPPPSYGSVRVARAPQSDDGAAQRARARIAAPALIMDLAQLRNGDPLRMAPAVLNDGGMPVAGLTLASAQADPTGAAIAAAGPPPGAEAAATLAPVAGAAEERGLNANERFATRAGKRETEVARAELLRQQHALVAQGTIIGAVMETALDSDVPGFARAVVNRDVLSFDGSQVMIPAGSRVIGEYNSGVAQGASRIFIVWNRLIRPDGVSIALGSPAVDDLGRGGLGGKVNRHFFQRFGGAILMSVLTGGITAATQSLSRGSTVIVGTTNEATALASQAARTGDIPPTIRTRQGATVRIFVARDLDFSAFGAAR